MKAAFFASASYQADGAAVTPIAAINNPTDSGVVLAIKALVTEPVAQETLAALLVRRCAALADMAVINNALTPLPWPVTSGAAAAAILATSASHTITPPAANTTNFLAARPLLQALGQRFPDTALEIKPGESVLLLLSEQVDTAIVFGVAWEERPLLPAEHFNDALPSAGDWTSGTVFKLPDDWREVTCAFAYTADVGSTSARPKMRVVWNDGEGAAVQPIVSTALDESAPPVAARYVRHLVEQFDPVTAEGTVSFALTYRIPVGMTSVRFDFAEVGDTGTPGSVIARIVGGR